MKSFFGGFFIDKEKLKKEGIYHPIKLEYYKKIDEQTSVKRKEDTSSMNNSNYDLRNVKYGIEIIKTEYINEQVLIEKKEISEITTDESVINKILSIFKKNEVTPISAKDVIIEIFTKNLQKVEK